MIKGELELTLDEQMVNGGKGKLYIRIQLCSATIDEAGKEKVDISYSPPRLIWINYKDRYVKFSLEDMVTEAVRIIDEKLGEKKGKNEVEICKN